MKMGLRFLDKAKFINWQTRVWQTKANLQLPYTSSSAEQQQRKQQTTLQQNKYNSCAGCKVQAGNFLK